MSLRVSAFLILLVALLPAQSVEVKGQLAGGAEGPVFVELRSVERRGPADRADVARDGSFEFRRVVPGSYHLVVTDTRGTVLRADLVNVGDHSRELVVRMPAAAAASPAGRVSIHRLTRKPVPAARKEFERGVKAAGRDRSADAIAHLTRAVQIDPDYAEAHNNLGVRYLLNQEFDSARRHFDLALGIDESLAEVHANLSLLFLCTHDDRAAEAHARRAIALNGPGVKTDYLLGLSLARLNRMEEAVPLLERVRDQYPQAARILASLSQQPSSAVNDESGARP